MAHILMKSHANGAKNLKAHLRKEITIEQALNALKIAHPLGLYDCCGVSNDARNSQKWAKQKKIVSVKALQFALRSGEAAGIQYPREEFSLIEVHDCFSITELVTMENLFISKKGEAIKDILDGFYDFKTGGVRAMSG
jgi:acetyl-CoA C-acetyltransferase